MQHTGHSSPLGAMTKFNPDEMWKKRSPSRETGENHHRGVRRSSTAWRSDRTPTVRVPPDALMTTVVDAMYGGVHDHRTREKE